jgi:hypothetical protein
VYLGVHDQLDIGSELANIQEHKIEKIFVHEEFDSINLFNDLALLILKKPAVLNENVQIACLPNPNQVFYSPKFNITAFISGWGNYLIKCCKLIVSLFKLRKLDKYLYLYIYKRHFL